MRQTSKILHFSWWLLALKIYGDKKKIRKKYQYEVFADHNVFAGKKFPQKSYLLSETERGNKDFTMGICLVVVETLCPVN